jgi:hypothetical protein
VIEFDRGDHCLPFKQERRQRPLSGSNLEDRLVRSRSDRLDDTLGISGARQKVLA